MSALLAMLPAVIKPAVLPTVRATADNRFRHTTRTPFRPCRKAPQSVRPGSAQTSALAQAAPQPLPKPAPEVAFYRKFTEAMLYRFMSLSLDAGRVPSLMGRELFKGNVSHCRMTGFDGIVHFVHDLGNCLNLLSPGQQHLVRRIAVQGYTQAEVSALLGVSLRTIVRRYAEAIDRLTTILIERKLIEPYEVGGGSRLEE